MTWQRFMRQFTAEGREKADGYSPLDFEDMSEDELARARAMMLERALAGDTIDLGGLKFVGDAGTARALEQAGSAQASGDWRYDIIRHEVLFNITDDQRYLFALDKYLDGRDPKAQNRAAYSFTWYVLPRTTAGFLADRIADGRHEAALTPLLMAWIAVQTQAMCSTPCLQRNVEFVRAVCDAPARRRRALLDDGVGSLVQA